jgi:hypothetical protein
MNSLCDRIEMQRKATNIICSWHSPLPMEDAYGLWYVFLVRSSSLVFIWTLFIIMFLFETTSPHSMNITLCSILVRYINLGCDSPELQCLVG